MKGFSRSTIYAKDKKEKRFIWSFGFVSGVYNYHIKFDEIPTIVEKLNTYGLKVGIETNIYSKKNSSRTFTTIRLSYGSCSAKLDNLKYSHNSTFQLLRFNYNL